MSNIKEFFAQPAVSYRFEELLGKRSKGFVASVLQIATSNQLLAKASPVSIYTAAATAAVLDLPVNQNLGYSWIVPYKNEAQFQIGYKGFVQLALRTGQYRNINVVEVYENQFVSFNSLTEELKGNFEEKPNGEIVGYAAHFELLNGFTKTVYWTTDKVKKHAAKYSKAVNFGPWKTDFDEMAKKTVLKNCLSKWGVLSIEMQTAVLADQSVQTEEGKYEYVDNDNASFDLERLEVQKERARVLKHIQNCKTAEELSLVANYVEKHNLEEEYQNKLNQYAD